MFSDPSTAKLCSRVHIKDKQLLMDMNKAGGGHFFGGMCSSALTEAYSYWEMRMIRLSFPFGLLADTLSARTLLQPG